MGTGEFLLLYCIGQMAYCFSEAVGFDTPSERGGGLREPLVVKVTHAGLPMLEL